MSTSGRGDVIVPGAVAVPSTGTMAEGGGGEVEARGYWASAWRRLKKDRLAIFSIFVIIAMILIAFVGAPVAQSILGHGPNDLIDNGVINYAPAPPWTHVKDNSGHETLLVLGASDLVGRDEFLRLLYGAQVSLEVGILATLLGLIVGVAMGMIAGFYGGFVDTIVSRLTEIVMAFPLLLFLVALAATVGPRLANITLGGVFSPGVVALVIVIALFTWFYPARIVRAQVLSLREKEFIEAARMVGSSNLRIMRSHLLPHVVGSMIVYSTLTVAVTILLESTLSFLGVGLPPPSASWGNMLDEALNFYLIQPWLILWPGIALLILTLAFNLLGDGLRDALDPRAKV
jgi:peptide/nickel transport system permease protein